MNNRKKFSFFSIAVLLSLVLSLIHPGIAFADGDMPPTDPPEAAVTPDSGTAPDTTEVAAPAETPVSESPSIEIVPTDAPPAEALPAAEPAVVETQVSDLVVALADAGVVVVDAVGETVPLASQQVAEILSQPMPDPIGCPPGVAPVSWGGSGAGCTEFYPSIQDAINDPLVVNGWTIYIETGSYAENVTINKNVTLTGEAGGATAQKFILNSDIGNASNNIFAPVINVNPGGSIQDGILLVSSGGTVNVAAGTYNETITIPKAMTLRSVAGPASTTIDGLDGDPYVVTINHSNVTVDGFSITNPQYVGGSDPTAILIEDTTGTYSHLRITNNWLHDIGPVTRNPASYGTGGIVVRAGVDVEIDHNKFYNIWNGDPSSKAFGINLNSVSFAWDDTDNINIHDNTFSDIYSPGTDDAGIRVSAIKNSAAVITIQNNIFINTGDHGIWFRYPSTGGKIISNNTLTGGSTGLIGLEFKGFTDDIYDNVITGYVRGIVVDAGSTAVPRVYGNDFSGNTTLGLDNRSGLVLDASGNWWGDTSGPYENTDPDACGLTLNNPGGTGSASSGCVIYNPYLTADPFLPSGGNGAGGGDEIPPASPDNGEKDGVGNRSLSVLPPVITGMIPVTGGQQTKITCDNPSFSLQTGDTQVTFSNLCGYDVVIDSPTKADLPGNPGSDHTFIAGVKITLLKDGKPVETLPTSAAIQVSFSKTAGGTPTVMTWDGGSWAEESFSEVSDRITMDLSSPGTVILVTR
jgi:nitrous oxidase accessory protein NosD